MFETIELKEFVNTDIAVEVANTILKPDKPISEDDITILPPELGSVAYCPHTLSGKKVLNKAILFVRFVKDGKDDTAIFDIKDVRS